MTCQGFRFRFFMPLDWSPPTLWTDASGFSVDTGQRWFLAGFSTRVVFVIRNSIKYMRLPKCTSFFGTPCICRKRVHEEWLLSIAIDIRRKFIVAVTLQNYNYCLIISVLLIKSQQNQQWVGNRIKFTSTSWSSVMSTPASLPPPAISSTSAVASTRGPSRSSRRRPRR